ncbi:integrase core domain-containing protein [Nocardia seriolae]|uniref:integrase core domain-containing protein n=1 Tax=Nocardia seriolae TaxID=37332 RepID=UPI0011606CC4
MARTILHSDRGGEFTAGLTTKACARHGLRRSMGATGICWDNSPPNRCGRPSSTSSTTGHTFTCKAELVAAVDKWVDRYNTTRRHSAIGGISPIRYERSLETDAANARKHLSTVRGNLNHPERTPQRARCQEERLVDLAADDELPQDKIKARLRTIRAERANVESPWLRRERADSRRRGPIQAWTC